MRTTTTAIASAALALFACSKSGFNTPTLLNKGRVLAIKAEPPQPALGASTTLSKLVYLPPPPPAPAPADGADAGVSVTEWDWSWCPLPMSAADPAKCPIGQPEAAQLFAGISDVPVPPLYLGRGETATFTNPFPAPILASLCRRELDAIPALAAPGASNRELVANGGLSFACTVAGFPITVKLVRTIVDTSTGDSKQDLPAVFTVYLPINDAIPANVNPVLNSISVTVNGSDHQLDEAGSQGILPNSSVPVVLDMDPNSSELLPNPNDVLPPPPDPNLPPYLSPNDNPEEKLDMSWYAECGDFGGKGLGGRRTGYLGNPTDPHSTFESALRNTWNIPKEGCSASSARIRITVVVRDSRGGVDWLERFVHLVDPNSDGGWFDSQEADGSQAPPESDAGTSDLQEAAVLDAGALDVEGVLNADALQEPTP